MTGREDIPGSKRLVGYVVPGADEDPAGSLKAFLRKRLPDYMVPAVFVTLDRLPMSANGKLDRRALPAADHCGTVGRAPSSAPEELLCRVFAEVLGLPEVDVDDGFFDLGGHSPLAVRLIGRIRTETGADLTPRQLFETPTGAGAAPLTLGAATAPQNRDRDLAADLRIDPAAAGAAAPAAPLPPSGPAAVLLTGATGFHGANSAPVPH